MFKAFHRSAAGEFQRIEDRERLAEICREGDGLLWVDLVVTDGEEHEVEAILRDVFHFHPLTIEDCVSPQIDPAKLDDHGEYIFVVAQALAPYQRGKELRAVEADFYLGPNYVVSCRREEVHAIDRFRELVEKEPQPLDHSADWLLHALLDGIVDDYLPAVDAVDEAIEEVEEEVLSRPDQRILRQIILIKRNTLRLRRAISPQREIMNRLSRGEFPKLVSQDHAIYFRDVYDHLVRVEYLVEALRDLADGALNTYLSAVSNRLNEVMKVLTAAAAVFLPLTLISGIYGMNFSENQFPGFDQPWGFAVVVGAMFVIALGLLAFFRYRRWI